MHCHSTCAHICESGSLSTCDSHMTKLGLNVQSSLIIALGFLTTSKTATIAFYQFKWIQMKEASCHPFITFFSEILFRITLNTTFSPEMQHYSKYRVHTLLGKWNVWNCVVWKFKLKFSNSQVWKQKSLWKIAVFFSWNRKLWISKSFMNIFMFYFTIT